MRKGGKRAMYLIEVRTLSTEEGEIHNTKFFGPFKDLERVVCCLEDKGYSSDDDSLTRFKKMQKVGTQTNWSFARIETLFIPDHLF